MTPSSENYIDGFLLPLPKENLPAYREAAAKACAIWCEYGATGYIETVIDDDKISDMRSFAEAAGAGENEVVILAWATFPSKEVRDAANAKIMEDPRTAEICAASGDIFDCKKMAFAGFRPIVES